MKKEDLWMPAPRVAEWLLFIGGFSVVVGTMIGFVWLVLL